MPGYIAVIEQNSDEGAYEAWFPDAPGCIATGKTKEETIDAASEALSDWVADEEANGRAVPPPRSYDELLTSGDHRPGHDLIIATIPLRL